MQERTDLTVEDYKGTLNENPSSCKHRRILGQPQSQPHVFCLTRGDALQSSVSLVSKSNSKEHEVWLHPSPLLCVPVSDLSTFPTS